MAIRLRPSLALRRWPMANGDGNGSGMVLGLAKSRCFRETNQLSATSLTLQDVKIDALVDMYPTRAQTEPQIEPPCDKGKAKGGNDPEICLAQGLLNHKDEERSEWNGLPEWPASFPLQA
ncbi:hypothetical protein AXG93_2960s1050 [Marchantia polymorpha subsp. ruderalis]|uniref:Uncharacterized protein n=1 Tax=Marchantia polymorpha subsp. ruderalis TaxID=1480154 RepID=A0A176W775_MARPO|nr:hypothetical protein AXG93_2960s1050 [Marchantia polymorpha subsp. ruderalis]